MKGEEKEGEERGQEEYAGLESHAVEVQHDFMCDNLHDTSALHTHHWLWRCCLMYSKLHTLQWRNWPSVFTLSNITWSYVRTCGKMEGHM